MLAGSLTLPLLVGPLLFTGRRLAWFFSARTCCSCPRWRSQLAAAPATLFHEFLTTCLPSHHHCFRALQAHGRPALLTGDPPAGSRCLV